MVANASKATVTLSDNTTWEASLVGVEADKDGARARVRHARPAVVHTFALTPARHPAAAAGQLRC